ncbi:hypothetical protein GbCGDNIH7_8324 [Granulibacter bethesdensis]|nr:hypothetical protein GbCGDNIH7_8324 [Granulibacter bethesdensis]
MDGHATILLGWPLKASFYFPSLLNINKKGKNQFRLFPFFKLRDV